MLNVLTIVLDGMPFITHHLPVLNRLRCDWRWVIVEGAAANTHCTYWCKAQSPRLSSDGTTQYLDSIARHPRVGIIRRSLWDGKVEMVNAGVQAMTEPGVLLQVDSDELWSAEQLDNIAHIFRTHRDVGWMNFYCNYFIGPNIVCTDNLGEWVRAWRYSPGMQFQSHEPPRMAVSGRQMDRNETKQHGLVFDHMSYVLEQQVAFKERFYGYAGATAQWRKFQENQNWPVARLRDHLSFAGAGATADLFIR